MVNQKRRKFSFREFPSLELVQFQLQRPAVMATLLLLYGISLVTVISGRFRFWTDTGPLLLERTSFFVVPLLGSLLWMGTRYSRSLLRYPQLLLGLNLGLVLLFFSDWLSLPFSFFPTQSVRGEIIFGSVLSLGYLSLSASKRLSIPPAFLLIIPAIFLTSFLSTLAGEMIFSDDHPSVVYRLQLLKEHFPFIPTYNAFWNAGTDARDFFATGILNLYFLAWPLLKIFPVESVYSFIVALVLFVLVPLSTYWAVRMEGGNSRLAWLSTLLSLSTSAIWYRWCLSYGSMGFITSTACFPLGFALSVRAYHSGITFNRKMIFLALITLTLCFLWSAQCLSFIPLLLLSLFSIRRLLSEAPIRKLVLGLLVLNLPWMILFISVSRVGSFLSHEGVNTAKRENAAILDTGSARGDQIHAGQVRAAGADWTDLAAAMKRIREIAVKSNPVILLFFIPGVLLLPNTRSRLPFGLTIVWLVFLGSIGAGVKPQLELERMLVVLVNLAVVPTTFALGAMFGLQSRSARVLGSVAGGFLFAGIFCTLAIIGNRTPERYTTRNSLVEDMSKAIRTHGGDGRTLFSGFILHELNGGHIAPLPHFTGKPLLASSPVHNLWWYTDIIPHEFRAQGPAGIEEYMSLMNVTAVLTHERVWKRYFDDSPFAYTHVWSGGRFKMYHRFHPSGGYFFSGQGEILEQTTRHVRLRVDSPEAVIKFAYLPFLRSSACRLAPHSVRQSLNFISLTECTPGGEVVIDAPSGFSRVFGE